MAPPSLRLRRRAPVADLDHLASRADDLIVWIVLGLVFLWVVSFAAETVMSKLKPVLIFVVAAGLIGVVVANLLGKL